MTNVSINKKDLLEIVHGSINLIKSVHNSVEMIRAIDQKNFTEIQKSQLQNIAALLLDSSSEQIGIIEKMTISAQPANDE